MIDFNPKRFIGIDIRHFLLPNCESHINGFEYIDKGALRENLLYKTHSRQGNMFICQSGGLLSRVLNSVRVEHLTDKIRATVLEKLNE